MQCIGLGKIRKVCLGVLTPTYLTHLYDFANNRYICILIGLVERFGIAFILSFFTFD